MLGALCFIAIGLLVGSVAKTEDAAAAMANLVTLPMTFLAGVFFPLDSAPGVVQAVSKVLPLTYLADGLRGVAVRDHSFAWTLPKLGVLAAFTVVIVGGLAAQLPLDVAVSVRAGRRPAGRRSTSRPACRKDRTRCSRRWASPAAARVGVPTLADALAGTADAVAAAEGLPFALLGECTLAPGFLAGALRRDPDAVFVWVDSHGDLNTPGDVAQRLHRRHAVRRDRRLVGRGAPRRLRTRARRRGARRARRGARSRSGEASMLAGSQIVSTEGVAGALDRPRPGDVPIVMHVDGDILDPSVAPGVDVPAPGGWDVAAAARRDVRRRCDGTPRRAQPVLRQPAAGCRRAERARLPRGAGAAARVGRHLTRVVFETGSASQNRPRRP